MLSTGYVDGLAAPNLTSCRIGYMSKHLSLVGVALLLVGCKEHQLAGSVASAREFRGQAFAQASCSSCHAIGPGSASSPNPRSPEFALIVNREGLTAETLAPWLQGAHNFPTEMDFQLKQGDVDDLVRYMLTLRDLKYRTPS